MSLTAADNRPAFKPAPAGLLPAVCVDVVDHGEVMTPYRPKPVRQISLRWQIDKTDPDTGRRFVVSRRYSLSLNERSTLSKDLENWRSVTFTPADRRAGFELEQLIGDNCLLQVVQEPAKDGTGQMFARVRAVLPSNGTTIRAEGYTRVGDRPQAA